MPPVQRSLFTPLMAVVPPPPLPVQASVPAPPSVQTRLKEALSARIPGVTFLDARAAATVSTGIPALDGWLGGWPRRGVVEVVGAPGSGRLALMQGVLRARGADARAWMVVDPSQVWSGVSSEGVDGPIVVRPPPARTGWVVEQVARSGAVSRVFVLDDLGGGRSGLRLARAAEQGDCCVFVVAEVSDPSLPASVRVRVEGWERAEDGASALRMTCVRHRGGRHGERVVPLPYLSVGASVEPGRLAS